MHWRQRMKCDFTQAMYGSMAPQCSIWLMPSLYFLLPVSVDGMCSCQHFDLKRHCCSSSKKGSLPQTWLQPCYKYWLRLLCYQRWIGTHYFTVVDRAKDMMLVGGENVAPAEVEASLNLHPSVAQAAVFGMKDRLLGEKIVAHIKIEPSIHQVEDVDCNRLEKQLTAWCFERLSYFKVKRKHVRYMHMRQAPTMIEEKMQQDTSIETTMGMGNDLCTMYTASGLSLHNLRPLSIEEADLAAKFLSTMKALLDFGCQDFLVLFPAFQLQVLPSCSFESLVLDSIPKKSERAMKIVLVAMAPRYNQLSDYAKTVNVAVHKAVRSLLGRYADPSEPLMGAGITSREATQLVSLLQDDLNMTLPATLMFDHPTTEAISTAIKAYGSTINEASLYMPQEDNPRHEKIVGIKSMACQLPEASDPRNVRVKTRVCLTLSMATWPGIANLKRRFLPQAIT
eukprot:jgi/Tetstr1/433802/TSEL_002428.t1